MKHRAVGHALSRVVPVGLRALAAGTAWADRPFVATTSATAEEDDDNVWSVSTWAQRDTGRSEFGLNVEYAFEPRLSSEFTLTRSRPRLGGAEASLEAEVEVKWLYNNIARDGWGMGISLGLGASKEGDEGWRGGGWQVVVPFSWQWSETGLLHLNAGVTKERGERRESLASVGLEWAFAPRWTTFGEWATSGDGKLTHAGVRWWFKREKYALDFSALRRQPEGGSATTGWVVNFSIYDL